MSEEKKPVAICANCGKVDKSASKKDFRCPVCGCEVAVVVPYNIFLNMVKSGAARE